MKHAKKSFYNHEIGSTEDSRILIFNSRTSAYGIMDNDTRSIYECITDKNTVRSGISINKDIVRKLLTNGYIIPNELDEFDLLQVNERFYRFNIQRLTLVVAPTLDCDMSCSYAMRIIRMYI